MKNILIPIDGSDDSKRAIEMGKTMAKAFQSNVTILNVVPLGLNQGFGEIDYTYIPFLMDGIPEFSAAMLEEAKKQFEGMDNPVETVCQFGNVAGEIVDYAHDHDVDLVIMGSHGLGALKNRIMTGSVTTRVLHHINKPVLVVK